MLDRPIASKTGEGSWRIPFVKDWFRSRKLMISLQHCRQYIFSVNSSWSYISWVNPPEIARSSGENALRLNLCGFDVFAESQLRDLQTNGHNSASVCRSEAIKIHTDPSWKHASEFAQHHVLSEYGLRDFSRLVIMSRWFRVPFGTRCKKLGFDLLYKLT